MAPRKRCPTCGSKQWHKEPSSGLIACSEGHVLQNYRNETTEITEVGPHAMKKRTLKSKRKKKEDTSKADPKLYHGARGRYHYFLCLQLLLRKQVAALISMWDLPPEFETICRDIWALHLSLLADPPPAEPHNHAQEIRGQSEGNPGETITPKISASLARDTDDSEGSATERDDDRAKADKKESEEEIDGDSELEALLREDSEISSSSSSDGEEHAPPKKVSTKRKRRGHSTYESPVSTIGILVVACWTLRIPVMLVDLTRLIESYELPYLDPTIRVLPPSVVQHLTKQNVQALSPRYAPETLAIHSVASRIGKKLYGTYGVYTPECNAASLLWRLVKAMAGSPMVYQLAKRTASVLSTPLTLHSKLSPEGSGQVDTGRSKRNDPPEVALMGCIIIVLKLVYGLDGKERCAEDVGWAMGEAGEYLKEMKRMEEEDLEKKETRFGAKKDLRVGDMDESEMDRYINFCDKALLGKSQESEGGIWRYFGRTGVDRHGEKEGAAEGDRRGLKGRGTGGQLRAGSEYKIWNGRDEEGIGAIEYGDVLRRAAAVVGVASARLGESVNKQERQLVQWIAAQKRRGRSRRT